MKLINQFILISGTCLIVYFGVCAKNAYGLDKTFEGIKGFYLTPANVKYNPSLYFEGNQVLVSSTVINRTFQPSQLANIDTYIGDINANALANLQLGFIRVGASYEQKGYRNVYSRVNWSGYASVPVPFTENKFYFGASYLANQEYFSSKDLVGKQYDITVANWDMIYSLSYKGELFQASFNVYNLFGRSTTVISSSQREIGAYEINGKDASATGITVSLAGNVQEDFKIVLDTDVNVSLSTDYNNLTLSYFLTGIYDYDPIGMRLVGGVNFKDGASAVNAILAVVYEPLSFINIGYGYKVSLLAGSFLGDHEVSATFKFDWPIVHDIINNSSQVATDFIVIVFTDPGSLFGIQGGEGEFEEEEESLEEVLESDSDLDEFL